MAKNKSPPLSGISKKAASVIDRAYEKMPENPFLDKGTTALALVCVAIYVAFILAAYWSSSELGMSQSIIEPSILPNTALQLRSGETYAYQLLGEESILTYRVSLGKNCSGVQVEDNAEQAKICIASSGRLLGEETHSNFRLGNHTFVVFEPWMLALSNSSDWRLETVTSAGGISISSFSYLRCTGEERIGGRQAFRVQSGTDSGAPVTVFVDKEKRVLLLADALNVSIRLVRAPFPLNWSSQ